MEQNKVVALSKEQHAKTKISNENALSHVADQHMLPVVVQEFVVAGAEFPVVFVKDGENDSYQPVVLLGLAANQNLVIQDGKWQALYVPRVARNYPLVLVQPEKDSDRLIVAVDESSERVNEKDGVSLFKDDGSETDYLADRKKQMGEFVEFSRMTRGFSQKLKSLDLIKEQVLTITVDGEPRNINGIHMIDEKKLNALSDEVFLELRKLGFLTAIYAHLMSLQHTQKLVQKLVKPA
ncbi:MAG: multidrug transporter [Rheinheimera sp.]|uniref:SapC family protein n=1 Tax=Arsukibacterium sp. UBA3155 TaxID=1946058 RepID=UPI000C8CBB2C|nr:SapC family protein [Arsukibacterium sp. UBA3155]MAD75773.1 multidrug transporter [Rheinheimera sp.]|tara:strand:- start:44701 stop:45411 length:711 start_codon:yes stop_codon:yes gene_type:complete